MHPKEKKRRALEATLTKLRLHITGCEICTQGSFVPEGLAKHLGLEDGGLVRQALDRMVLEGFLTKLDPADVGWVSRRTRYMLRSLRRQG